VRRLVPALGQQSTLWDERKRACACGSSPMGVRASTTRRSAVVYHICRTASRRRDAESARLPVRPAVGVGRTMRALRSLTQTDACPKSCSGARNSGPMGLDNIDHQRQLQIPAASLPLAWMSLRARRRTVAHSAVARFSADMEVITCAHVHVQELKLLPCCPFMRSSIKHVDPCTGSLASPLHALSPSSSSTFKSFANSTPCDSQQDLGTRVFLISFYHRDPASTVSHGDPWRPQNHRGSPETPKPGGSGRNGAKKKGIPQAPRGSRDTLRPLYLRVRFDTEHVTQLK